MIFSASGFHPTFKKKLYTDEKDAPHFGAMFDADEIRKKVIDFLKLNLK